VRGMTKAAVLVLFDGACNLCTASSGFLARQDVAGVLRFCPMQSDLGTALLARFNLPGSDYRTFVVLDRGQLHFRSDAALHLVPYLRARWRWLGLFRLVPRRLRDALYDLVARSRYRVFGRRTTCLAPPRGAANRLITTEEDYLRAFP